jgi:hypothetical protein
MFRRPMTRLAIAAAAAGTICALGASAASAAPNQTWSGPKLVPGSLTNDSPGASSVSFPVANGQGQLVGWRGRGEEGHIYYKYRVPGLNKGKWSKEGKVPGETSSAPAFGSYIDTYGADAVLAVWTGPADHHIWYSQGETKANGTISWKAAVQLPASVADTNTSNGPAVLFPNHSYRVVIAWRGPANHVRYVVGIPSHRTFVFGPSRAIPGPSVTTSCKDFPCTGKTPALAEVNTNASSGTIYFFWRQLSTRAVIYATTADTDANLHSPAFTAPTPVPGAASIEGPAASDTGIDGFGPLLLAYKAPLNTGVLYQTLTGTTWSAPAVVPNTHTNVAPALLFNELATTTPATDGNVVLHAFTP